MIESEANSAATCRSVVVDGVRTHYIERGTGRPLVLLHDGAYGGCAEVSWFANIAPLARKYRVVAPDILGFGETDKLFDFGGARARRVWHLKRFLEIMDISQAAFCGSSMGASILFQALTEDGMRLPISAAVCISGGGLVPANEARRQILDFDCTIEGMRKILRVMLHDEKLLNDERILDARFRSATAPGAWETTAAARFTSPLIKQSNALYGSEDRTPYDKIGVPVMVMAGEEDPLKLPGYAAELAKRIPQGEVRTFPRCAHFPNIECPENFNEAVLEFLTRVYPASEKS